MSEPAKEERRDFALVLRTVGSPDFRDKIKQALPPSVDLDRFTRTALTALQTNPDLADLDRQSLYNGIVRAAQDGLLPDGREGAIVPFKGKAKWMPMVAGLVKRAAEAGIRIDSEVVWENDEFDMEFGDNPRIVHRRPKLGMPRGERVVGAYAIATLPDGSKMREVIDVSDIERIRASSKQKGDSPWDAWYDEMARKSVVRRLSKRLPITDSRIASTLAVEEDDEYVQRTSSPQPAEAPTKPAKTRAATTILAGAPEPAPAPTPPAEAPAGNTYEHEAQPKPGAGPAVF